MILAKLKEQTRSLHDQAERTVDLPSRLSSLQQYACLLARFHGFYAPLEMRLATVSGFSKIGLDLSARRKTHLLSNDLSTFGMGDASIAGLPRCHDLADLTGVADVLGCLYVLEGATLGGQIVCRMAEKALGVTPDRGCSFFASYGGRVGDMWKEFGRCLEAYAATSPASADRIVAAAVATFAGLTRWVAEGQA